MSKRESSSVMLRNLKKRDLSKLGQPLVPFHDAERVISGTAATESTKEDLPSDSAPDILPDSYHASHTSLSQGTRLRPKERAARSALIVRLDPQLHRQLDEVARYNRLTMNDIVTEAIQMHLQNFPHPPDLR